MIFFRAMEIAGCCANLKTGRMPLVGSYGPGGVIDIDELANSKRAHLAAVRQGETPKACVDCPSWTLMDVADDDPYLFNDVNIGHHTACNTDCYYCNTNSNSAPVPIAARKAPRLFSLLKEMVERGYIDPDAIIRFGGGEPTILPEFEKLVDYFIDVGRRFFIASSGVRYSPAIERMLRVGRAGSKVVISLDSATPETYEIVKGLDLSHRVWENVRRYAQFDPDKVEVKYIVLPENAHETGEFVRKCFDIGIRRLAIDMDSRPIICGVSGTLNDEMIEGSAILIYEAKRRGMSVAHSGSGNALWEEEGGERRVKEALARLTGGRFTMIQDGENTIHLARLPQELDERRIFDWGRFENVRATPINSDVRAICLQEDASYSAHRVEQNHVPVTADEIYTLDVTARPRGRSKLVIEMRDNDSVYTRAVYDLEKARVENCMHKNAVAVSPVDDEWVRCQLTLKMPSNMAHFAVGLVDQHGAHVYQGQDHAGIDVLPPVLGRAVPRSLAR